MAKIQATGTIISQQEIAKDIFDIWIQVKEIAASARAGQFLSLYVDDASKLLPRPISICEVNQKEGLVRLVYRVTSEQSGTKMIAKKIQGDLIRVLGPLGNGFPLKQEKEALLIGGGIGIPPMLALAKERGKNTQIVAGYRSEIYLEEDLRRYGNLYIATEDGSKGVKGTVIDAIKKSKIKAQVIYACGPTPMLRAVKEYAKEVGIFDCYLSMEEKMACGIGACLACVCQSKEEDSHTHVKNKRVCKEGPVFLAWEVEI